MTTKILPSLGWSLVASWSSITKPSMLDLSVSILCSPAAELWFFLPNFNSRLNPFEYSLPRGFSNDPCISSSELMSTEPDICAMTLSVIVSISELTAGALLYSELLVHGSSNDDARARGALYGVSETITLGDLRI